VKPKINLPMRIMVPDRSDGEEVEETRESVALVPNLLAVEEGNWRIGVRQGTDDES
jgi:hypothetical protein